MRFQENQNLAPWILWFIRLLSIGLISINLWGFCQQVILGQPFGDKPGPDWVFPFMFLLQASIWWLFEKIQLSTVIDSKGIRMHFFPFTKKNIRWSAIDKAKIINYGFVGGWGIRLGTKYGTVYNTKGKEGVWLHLKDGSKFVIGTQKKQELEKVIRTYLP